MADYTIDARHLLCPLPVLRAQKKLQDMKVGESVEINGTDPSSIREFELFQKEQQDFKITHKKTSDTGWHLTLLKL